MTDNATRFSPGFFGRIFCGSSNWALTLSSTSSVLFYDEQKESISLATIATAPIEEGYFWSAITVGTRRLDGLTLVRCQMLVDAAQALTDKLKQQQARDAKRKAEEASLLAQFAHLYPSFERLSTAYDAFIDRGWYIRTYLLNDFLATWQDDLARLPSLEAILVHPLFHHEKQAEIRAEHRRLSQALTPPYAGITQYNERFVNTEIKEWADFFNNVEKSKLTKEQQIAAIVHEDRNLLVAAAGSGKSSTLVAKVGYALKKEYVKPDEILALAFNTDAARELSERLENRLNIGHCLTVE